MATKKGIFVGATFLNLELQTTADEDMELRLLLYHAELLIAYRLPVLFVVLYLFETLNHDFCTRQAHGGGLYGLPLRQFTR